MKSVLAVLATVLFTLGFVCFANAAELEYTTQQALVVAIDSGNRVIVRFGSEFRPANLKGVMASWKGAGGECFAEDSRQYLVKEILGKTVIVDWDSGDKVDKNGNLLVYLSYAGVDINAAVLEKGHGWVPKMFPADRKEAYLAIAKKAWEAGLGLWKSCDGQEFLKPHIPK